MCSECGERGERESGRERERKRGRVREREEVRWRGRGRERERSRQRELCSTRPLLVARKGIGWAQGAGVGRRHEEMQIMMQMVVSPVRRGLQH